MFPGAHLRPDTVQAAAVPRSRLSARPYGRGHQPVARRGAVGRQRRDRPRQPLQPLDGGRRGSSTSHDVDELRGADRAPCSATTTVARSARARRRGGAPSASTGHDILAAYEREARRSAADRRARPRRTAPDRRRTPTAPAGRRPGCLMRSAARRSTRRGPSPAPAARRAALAPDATAALRRGINTLALVLADTRIPGAAHRLRLAAVPGSTGRCRRAGGPAPPRASRLRFRPAAGRSRPVPGVHGRAARPSCSAAARRRRGVARRPGSASWSTSRPTTRPITARPDAFYGSATRAAVAGLSRPRRRLAAALRAAGLDRRGRSRAGQRAAAGLRVARTGTGSRRPARRARGSRAGADAGGDRRLRQHGRAA